MIFKRPSFAYSLLVTFPSVIFFGAVALLLGPLDFIFFPKRRPGPVGLWVKKRWCDWMFRSHGLRLHVLGPGANEIANRKSCVFVSNHQSAIDILVHVLMLPPNAHFVAKKELFWIPIFGISAAIVGTIFIDRSRGAQQKSLKKVVRHLQEGDSIILYPEGTRSRDGQIKEFKRGAFVMAIDAQVPIIPITIFNTRFLCPKGRLSVAPGDIYVYVDEPISTQGLKYEDRHALAKKVHELIKNRMNEYPELAFKYSPEKESIRP